MAHSTCESCHACCSCGFDAHDVDESPFASNDSASRSKSTSNGGMEGVPCLSSCSFSNPVPVHTREGRLLTISSGARSRWAAFDARTRCINRVMSVSDDGSNRMMAKVTMGLEEELSKRLRRNHVRTGHTNTTPKQNNPPRSAKKPSATPNARY